MSLPNGLYRTAAGSQIRISGEHGGEIKVDFDWAEEEACVECEPEACESGGDLVWHCEDCGGGRAKLFPAPQPEQKP